MCMNVSVVYLQASSENCDTGGQSFSEYNFHLYHFVINYALNTIFAQKDTK